MVISVVVCIKEILLHGRNFSWPKPEGCVRCLSPRLWGHGFIDAYFDGVKDPIALRRFRCPDCGCVIRLRPCGHFNRFQASTQKIKDSVVSRSTTGKFLKGICPRRQRHWFKALVRKANAFFGLNPGSLEDAFDRLVKLGQIPVSRSI